MDHRVADTGAQFVLDNRKLIVGFALLIVLCGTFFVIGFMEGKRQGVQRTAGQVQRGTVDESAPAEPVAAQPEKAAKTGPQPIEDKSAKEQFEWYKNVNKREAKPAETPAPRKKPATRPSPPEKTTYTVQVGAFKLRREAETRAAALKAAGYDYVITPGGKDEPLFLLKVGRFESRAQAVAMQLKLKKDGFATFVKANK